ncbi:MAG TPA: 2OG-Fe(II) oxygenase [Kofleriaceae bacterium]|jgi:hypothetical protein|nr:2OG-Fe(II) oxygenase [Kofleriaceae bacterium]
MTVKTGDAAGVWQVPADEDALAQAWRTATPYPHLVLDDAVTADALPALMAVLADEPVERYAGDIFVFDASPPQDATPELFAIRDAFAAALLGPLSRITGKPLVRADMRAYAYHPGHYLLPHSDHHDQSWRSLAFAYYAPSPHPPEGGELELFACRVDAGAIVETTSARVIEPRANRLVVFDVSDVSLHQVREVVAGLRVSLAGWFYP